MSSLNAVEAVEAKICQTQTGSDITTPTLLFLMNIKYITTQLESEGNEKSIAIFLPLFKTQIESWHPFLYCMVFSVGLCIYQPTHFLLHYILHAIQCRFGTYIMCKYLVSFFHLGIEKSIMNDRSNIPSRNCIIFNFFIINIPNSTFCFNLHWSSSKFFFPFGGNRVGQDS